MKRESVKILTLLKLKTNLNVTLTGGYFFGIVLTSFNYVELFGKGYHLYLFLNLTSIWPPLYPMTLWQWKLIVSVSV